MGDSPNLHGKTCLITGPTQGIGRVTALEVAKSGANMVLSPAIRKKGKRSSMKSRLRAIPTSS